MTQNRDGPLPEAVAKQILARAAQIDASERMGVSVLDLKSAAVEAGISAAALDRALSEVTNVEDASPAQTRTGKSQRRKFAAVAIAVVIIGFWVALFATRMVVPIEEPAAQPVPEISPPR